MESAQKITLKSVLIPIQYLGTFKHPICMQKIFVSTTFFVTLFTTICAQTSLDKTKFYAVISSKNLTEINAELNIISQTPTHSEPHEGALLMKKAGLLTEAKTKLKTFKTGHTKLESAIAKDSTNAELRFLRLIIQENAPKIVNYSSEIKKDASYLRENYKNLAPEVRKALLDYCQTSKVLKREDFKRGVHE
jgi:hypothetical protein